MNSSLIKVLVLTLYVSTSTIYAQQPSNSVPQTILPEYQVPKSLQRKEIADKFIISKEDFPGLYELYKADEDKQKETERKLEAQRKISETRQRLLAKEIITPDSEFAIIKNDLKNNVRAELRPFVRYMTSAFIPSYDTKIKADFVKIHRDEKTQRSLGVLVPDEKNFLNPKLFPLDITNAELVSRVGFFGVNSLSRAGAITTPEFVEGTNNRIFRFYLSAYTMLPKDWEAFAADDMYFKDIVDLEVSKLTGTYRPILRTDWFLAKAFFEPNYSRLLYSGKKIPQNENELITFFGIDVKKIQENNSDYGAAVKGITSGVATQDRLLIRYRGVSEYYHVTNDFLTNVDKLVKGAHGKNTLILKSPIEHLLQPADPNIKFQADGKEHIFAMSNGMQAYAITDAKGKIVAKAEDTDLVRDTRNSKQPKVATAKSCIWCHDRGINIPINVIEKHLGTQLQFKPYKDYDQKSIEVIRRFYATKYGALVRQDINKYEYAMAECNLLYSAQNATAFRTIVQRYDYDPVTLDIAAMEVGCTPDFLRQQIMKWSVSTDLHTMCNPTEPEPIDRRLWEVHYPSVRLLLKMK